jgi:hypothetical protein
MTGLMLFAAKSPHATFLEIQNPNPSFPLFFSSLHVPTNNFNITELNFAISSRKSIASGLDNISPILVKHLPTNTLVSYLNIFNDILKTQQFSTS